MYKREQNNTKFYHIISLNNIKTVVIKCRHFIKSSLYKLSINIRVSPYMPHYVNAFSSALDHIMFPIHRGIRHKSITNIKFSHSVGALGVYVDVVG